MTNKTITGLTAASTLDGSELVSIVQGGNSRKTTVQNIAAADIGGAFTYGGDRYHIGGCVLRQDTAGSGWYAIDDSGHVPIDVSSVSVSGGDVVVAFDGSYSKIVSFLATPDEALAKLGFTCGASVDVTQARIELAAPLEMEIEFNGTVSPVVSVPDYFTGVSASVSLSGGTLTVAHEATLNELPTQPVTQTLQGTDLDLVPLEATSRTSFQAAVRGPVATRIRYDTGLPGWVDDGGLVDIGFYWSASNGLSLQFGTNIPADLEYGSQVTQYGEGAHTPYIRNQTSNTVFVHFKDDAGTKQTTLGAEMDFSFYRPGKFSYATPVGKYYISRGLARVSAENLKAAFPDQNSTNIWCIWIMKA